MLFGGVLGAALALQAGACGVTCLSDSLAKQEVEVRRAQHDAASALEAQYRYLIDSAGATWTRYRSAECTAASGLESGATLPCRVALNALHLRSLRRFSADSLYVRRGGRTAPS